MKRRFEYTDEKSNKFWEVSLSDTNVVEVYFGRIGTAGQNKSNYFETVEEAQNHINKVINQKIKKGYVENV